jgi:hypothetical protein
MATRTRRYQDPHLQRAYDGTRESYRSGTRGWVRSGKNVWHGLWNEDGTRFVGASMHSAFWKGFDGLTLSRGRIPYMRGSLAFVVYMAGRDAAREEAAARSGDE